MTKDLEKAKITVFKSEGEEEMEVMFNPSDLSLSEIATYGTDEANPQFNGTKLQDFSVTLFFDTYEKFTEKAKKDDFTDVREYTEKFSEMIQPTEPGQSTRKPPMCMFSWGKIKYKGVILQVDQKFTMFLSDGTPVRAAVTVKFKSVLTSQEAADLRGLEACRKVVTVKEGDRLDLIAARELKDAALWTKIAFANNIDDPFKFPEQEDIGTILIIPD